MKTKTSSWAISFIAVALVGLAAYATYAPSFVQATGPSLEQLCHNGIDDDHDGYIDLLDSQCAEFRPVCEEGFHSNENFECVEDEEGDPVCVPPQILVEHVCTTPEGEEPTDMCPDMDGVQTSIEECPPPPEECPEGQIGTFPDCSTPEQTQCAEGQVGTYPDCTTPQTEEQSSGGGGGKSSKERCLDKDWFWVLEEDGRGFDCVENVPAIGGGATEVPLSALPRTGYDPIQDNLALLGWAFLGSVAGVFGLAFIVSRRRV